jgi:1,4-dihydroxy-2-naphthoyl-CoA synthase
LTGYEDITYEVDEAAAVITINTDEAKKGAQAFAEKRSADFARYVTA